MRGIILFLFLFHTMTSFAQLNWGDKFTVNDTFSIGQEKNYQVSEFFKIDNLFFGDRYEIKSNVNFNVVDTSNGGYWINYYVTTNLVNRDMDSTAYIISTLMDGINLYFFAKNGILKLDSSIYYETKKRIVNKLDSMSTQQAFGKTKIKFIEYLRTQLKKDAGLGYLLAPLLLFEDYYSSFEYKKFRITKKGSAQDILNSEQFSGDISQEWSGTSKDKTVNLNRIFVGHPVGSAKYYKSIYEPIFAEHNIKVGKNFWPPEMRYLSSYKFQSIASEAFPKFLYKKVVSEYFFRSVLKIEMKDL